MTEYKCGDCFHAEVCEKSEMLVGFSKDNYAYCGMFLDSADVAPVRHGRWEKQSGLYSCSECGMTCPYDVQADVIEYWACNYCPNCGVKMDGSSNEE